MLDKNEELTLEDIKTHLKSRYERLGKKRHDGALSVNYRGGSGQRYGNNGSFKKDTYRRNKPFNKGRLYCTYCKKSGHSEFYCFKKKKDMDIENNRVSSFYLMTCKVDGNIYG